VKELRREEKLEISRFPTKINSSFIFPHTFRWIVNNTIAAGTSVNLTTLLSYTNALTVSAATCVGIIGSIRIRRLQLWSASAVSGGAAAASFGAFTGVGIEWLSTQSKSVLVEDYGDINRPAHVSSRPPRGSLAADWFSTTGALATNIFRIYGAQFGNAGMQPTTPLPPGTIVDLEVVMTLLNPADSAAIAYATANAGTIGSILLRGLDGLALAATAYNVIGYPAS